MTKPCLLIGDIGGTKTRLAVFYVTGLRLENLAAAGRKALVGFITAGDPDLALMVGVDTQVVHGIVHCGASGAITGVGNALPREILHLVGLCERAAIGDHEALRLAQELESALAVLSSYDEGPDLVLYYKHLMVLEGNPEYAHQLNADDQLSASQRAQLECQWQQFRSWWNSWPGTAA